MKLTIKKLKKLIIEAIEDSQYQKLQTLGKDPDTATSAAIMAKDLYGDEAEEAEDPENAYNFIKEQIQKLIKKRKLMLEPLFSFYEADELAKQMGFKSLRGDRWRWNEYAKQLKDTENDIKTGDRFRSDAVKQNRLKKLEKFKRKFEVSRKRASIVMGILQKTKDKRTVPEENFLKKAGGELTRGELEEIEQINDAIQNLLEELPMTQSASGRIAAQGNK